jgi:serine phosphatase RsbU (regulator of sigma subunit)/PAS domain-containing protein
MPELDDLRGQARGRAIIAEARVVLAGRLGVEPGEALQHLIWLARDLDLELDEAAALVTGAGDGTGAPGRAAPEIMPLVEAGRAAESGLEGDKQRLEEVPADPAVQAVLDSSIDAAVHLVPVRDSAGGKVLDFLYAEANAATRDLFGRGPSDLWGKRLLRMDPGSALMGLFAAYVEAMETGRPYRRGPFEFSTAQDGVTRTARMSVRGVPVRTGLCVTWRYHDDEDRMRRRLDRVGRLALMGFAEWDLASDELELSTQMALNYGLDPQRRHTIRDQMARLLMDEDRHLVEERMRTMLSRRAPVEMEHRVVTPDGENRHLWVFAEPVLDTSGRPVSVNVVSQDITRRRGIERALAETRREMLRQQAANAQERRVAATMRRAILPDPEDLSPLPGLQIAVRSLAAESARIGGDWFATRVMPDERSLFAIGDAAGHGLSAAAAMARTRNGLLGLAYTGQSPGRLMAWLNEMVGQMQGPVATGTALVASYDPSHRVMQWACAGHLPPILVRGGRAVPLGADPAPMLGAATSVEYATITTRLMPGDLVFLYTDGLVERRDEDLDDRIARLGEILADRSSNPGPVLDRVLARMRHDRSDDTTLFAIRIE